MDSFSISNTLSRESVYESCSILQAYQDDAASRLADGEPEAISNEQIRKGDLLLETYRIEDDAIHGGMGSVWRVFHTGWNTSLAMKRPKPRFFAEGSNRRKEMFIAECEHWIDLGLHSNIVSCYYVREIGGVPTVFSEWMDGGDLKNEIESGKLYLGSEKEIQERILDIAIQTARGLEYAHERKLIHQDIKPSNILLKKGNVAAIADFGLAQANSRLQAEAADTSGTTEPEGTILTATGGYSPYYCSPEQFHSRILSRRTDIYSWALTVLEMYLGARRWKLGNEISPTNPELFVEAKAEIPEGIKKLIQRCLSQDLDERPHDFSVILKELYDLYRESFSTPYHRPAFRTVTESAEVLNNKALSYLDLQKYEEAENCWKLAMKNQSNHPESVYNELLYRWRKAEIDDLEVLKRIRSADDGSVSAMLCQLRIQIGRADPEARRCIEILEEDREVRSGSAEEEELKKLASLCETLCVEDRRICKASQDLMIADENDFLGYCEKDALVFRDSTGKELEKYRSEGRITNALFSPDYSRICLLCDDALVYERSGNLIARGSSAYEMITEWIREITCGKAGTDIVSLSKDPGSFPILDRLWSNNPKKYYRDVKDEYSKASKYKSHGNGDVLYILRPGGQILRTLRMSSENKKDTAINLNPHLYLDAQKTYIYRRSIPDIRHLPQMALSRISTYEESLMNDSKFEEMMKTATEEEKNGNTREALRRIDQAMNIPGHFTDRTALQARRKLMDSLPQEHYDRILSISEDLPDEEENCPEIPQDEQDRMIQEILKIRPDALGLSGTVHRDHPDMDIDYSVCRHLWRTQFPEIYIATAHQISEYEHPRYGDNMVTSRSMLVVYDSLNHKIIKSIGSNELGGQDGFDGDHRGYNNFDEKDPMSAALSNNQENIIASCCEKPLYSGLCIPENYIGPNLDYIFPLIADHYYLLFGKRYIGLAYISRKRGEMVWQDLSPYEKLIGFNREKSIFTIKVNEKETLTREILWNYEKPTIQSKFVNWENLDYFGPVNYVSTYF